MTPAEKRLRAALLVQKLHAAVMADDGPFGEAHRKILDLHQSCPAYGGGAYDRICVTCTEGSHLYDEIAYPCPTLLALAAGLDVA